MKNIFFIYQKSNYLIDIFLKAPTAEFFRENLREWDFKQFDKNLQ